MSDRIIKLVFLRVESAGQPARKAVVPLVEGCDFHQFQQRVRRRLGLPEEAEPVLSDMETGVVDSVDRLLEIDEGKTLDVRLPSGFIPSPAPPPRPAACAGAAGSTTPSARGPTQRASMGMGGPSSPMPECRLDVPASEWVRGGDDGGKYRKRRRDLVSLARSRRGVFALLGLGALGFLAFQFLALSGA